MKVRNIVLGAGIAGLAYAKELDKWDTLVIEKQDYLGGLCHSFCIDEFTFDSAVHLSFTNSETVRSCFDKTKYIKHLPISYNFYYGYWIKHPVVNNLFHFSTEKKVNLIEDFIKRDTNRVIRNYEDWLMVSYGKSITEEFYEKYTRKYWTVPSKELSTTWIGSRLGILDLRKMLYGAFSEETGIDYYAKEMRYPECGGYQSFINVLAEDVDVLCGNGVVQLDLANKRIILEDGSEYEYEYLASSIPLPELVKITKQVPEEILRLSKELKASKISLVSVGVNKADVSKSMWFYIYDEDIMAARVNSPSRKSVVNAPKNCSSLQFEIYHSQEEEIEESKIIDNVKYALKKMELCEEQDILFMDYRLLEYGNVIFTKGMEEKRNRIREYYEQYGVDLIGRFGEWEYFWSDQSYISGKKKGEERRRKSS